MFSVVVWLAKIIKINVIWWLHYNYKTLYTCYMYKYVFVRTMNIRVFDTVYCILKMCDILCNESNYFGIPYSPTFYQ